MTLKGDQKISSLKSKADSKTTWRLYRQMVVGLGLAFWCRGNPCLLQNMARPGQMTAEWLLALLSIWLLWDARIPFSPPLQMLYMETRFLCSPSKNWSLVLQRNSCFPLVYQQILCISKFIKIFWTNAIEAVELRHTVCWISKWSVSL